MTKTTKFKFFLFFVLFWVLHLFYYTDFICLATMHAKDCGALWKWLHLAVLWRLVITFVVQNLVTVGLYAQLTMPFCNNSNASELLHFGPGRSYKNTERRTLRWWSPQWRKCALFLAKITGVTNRIFFPVPAKAFLSLHPSMLLMLCDKGLKWRHIFFRLNFDVWPHVVL